MLPSHTQSRINLTELKAQMVKKLGPDASKQYFYYLNRFLSLKLSKVEFNNLCLRIFGRENIPLHNQLIRSILRNACTVKAPPPASPKDDVFQHGAQVTGKEIPADGYQPNGSHTAGSSVLANGGDMLPVSPRKARSNFRDRRSGDRRSALGLNGKTSLPSQLAQDTPPSDFNIILENGDLNRSDIAKPVQHLQGLMQQAHNETVLKFVDDLDPVYRMEKTALVVKNGVREDSEKSPLRAPLGLPFCSVSIGGARRAPPLLASSSVCEGTFNGGALMDSLTLRERMEQIAVAQGLEGVSVDCANVLNNGLDSYMKRIIRSCVGLVGTRSEREVTNYDSRKHHIYLKPVNGVIPGHQNQITINGTHLERQERKFTLQDFRVAMELNPQQLGEDWPLLLEKISTREYEE